MLKYINGLFCLSLGLIANPVWAESNAGSEVARLHYTVLAERSHRPHLFTEGLLVADHTFYESSGLYGKSQLVAYPIAEPEDSWAKITAPFSQKQLLPARFFAEGLTLLDNKLYLLTWQEGKVLVYSKDQFTLLNSLSFEGQGWGLATDGKQLIRSDGSSQLFFHNALTFAQERALKITYQQQPLVNLNELEYAEGFIWANIWHDNRIVKINPATGVVVGAIDLSDIVKKLTLKDAESVLNGIAYDAQQKAFWITGKNWPRLFLVKLR
jgi:glutamine cyclotransferase